MKKTLIYSLLLIGMIELSFTGRLSGQWLQNKFIIGTFCDPTVPINDNGISHSYLEKVKLAQDAYFNLFTDTRNKGVDIANYLKLVKMHDSLGIYTFYRIDYNSIRAQDRIALISDYGLHKTNIYSWYIDDEPSLHESEAVLKLANDLKERASEKLSYVNLLPIYAFEKIDEYENYLDAYLGDTTLKVVSYDFYPFHEHFFQGKYYTNLQMIIEKAKGRPVWIYPLTVPHSTYIDPERYHLNFMVFSPLTYGVKGIIYYTYETISYSKYYKYGNAIIDTLGNPSPKYYIVKDINRFVSKVAGPIILNSERVGTYHISNAPFESEEIDPQYLLNDTTPLLSIVSNTNIVTGIYRSLKDPTLYYLFMHNKKNAPLKSVFVSLKGNYVDNIDISSPVKTFTDSTMLFQPFVSRYNAGDNETELFVDFDPGELRILSVKNVTEPFLRKQLHSFEISIIPNPVDDSIEARFFLKEDEHINMSIYNNSGEAVRKLVVNSYLNKGKQVKRWDISSLKPGFYFMSISSRSGLETCKFLKL